MTGRAAHAHAIASLIFEKFWHYLFVPPLRGHAHVVDISEEAASWFAVEQHRYPRSLQVFGDLCLEKRIHGIYGHNAPCVSHWKPIAQPRWENIPLEHLPPAGRLVPSIRVLPFGGDVRAQLMDQKLAHVFINVPVDGILRPVGRDAEHFQIDFDSSHLGATPSAVSCCC